ncbi:hypothetical protein Bbelb_418660 [Branchiostoma belcheri]|nr:hypothetical protein Bbelb_418660 [Branchiostoma belcheri]
MRRNFFSTEADFLFSSVFFLADCTPGLPGGYTHGYLQGTTVLLKQDYYTDDASIRGGVRGTGVWNIESGLLCSCCKTQCRILFDKFFYGGAWKTYRDSNGNVQMQDCRSFIIRGKDEPETPLSWVGR